MTTHCTNCDDLVLTVDTDDEGLCPTCVLAEEALTDWPGDVHEDVLADEQAFLDRVVGALL